MKEIELIGKRGAGKVALVDDDDYEHLSRFKWYALKGWNTFYAFRNIKREDGKWRLLFMHREIVNTPKGILTDHKDHNGLNNQKRNLRNCTNQENQYNQRARGCSSKYKGVSSLGRGKGWRATIKKGETLHIGSYRTEQDAALAYNKKAVELFGEFANLNIILQ
jgi:hypothetical protein